MDTLKKHRTNMAKVASTATSLKMLTRVQEEESVHFLVNLLKTPDKLFDHIMMEAGAVILKVTYGYNVDPRGKDYLVDAAGKVMDEFSDAATPGRWMVDILPFRESVQTNVGVSADFSSEIRSRMDAWYRLEAHGS